MVPRRGLEPPRLSALRPEPSASTNSATWAQAAAGEPRRGRVNLRRQRFDVNLDEPMSRKPRWQQEDPRYAKPIPSREHLLAKLAEARRPLGFDALAGMLGISDPAERDALAKRLAAMSRDGELLVNRASEYCLVERLPVVVGTASGH